MSDPIVNIESTVPEAEELLQVAIQPEISFLGDYQLLKTRFVLNLMAEANKHQPLTPEFLIESQLLFLDCFVGVKETLRNSGKEVSRFQEWAHTLGQPWGASFLGFVLNDGIRGCLNSISPDYTFPTVIPMTGSAKKIWAWAKEEGLVVSEPEAGHIAVVSQGPLLQVEGVTVVDEQKKRFYAIGGNISIKGSLGGDGVYHVNRSFKGVGETAGRTNVLGFINTTAIYEKLIEGGRRGLNI